MLLPRGTTRYRLTARCGIQMQHPQPLTLGVEVEERLLVVVAAESSRSPEEAVVAGRRIRRCSAMAAELRIHRSSAEVAATVLDWHHHEPTEVGHQMVRLHCSLLRSHHRRESAAAMGREHQCSGAAKVQGRQLDPAAMEPFWERRPRWHLQEQLLPPNRFADLDLPSLLRRARS